MSNKLINAAEAHTKAIYHGIDMVSGGLLSQVKSSIAAGYQGYFEEKIYSLIIDLKKNKISEEEILDFIDNMGDYDKNILYSIMQKNISSEHKFKTFLLSKVWLYKMLNDELDYFHATLLSSLELFSFIDYEIIYQFSKNSTKDDNKINIPSSSVNNNTLSTIQKLKSIGFFNGFVLDGGGFDNDVESFYFFEHFEHLEEYILEYFERN